MKCGKRPSGNSTFWSMWFYTWIKCRKVKWRARCSLWGGVTTTQMHACVKHFTWGDTLNVELSSLVSRINTFTVLCHEFILCEGKVCLTWTLLALNKSRVQINCMNKWKNILSWANQYSPHLAHPCPEDNRTLFAVWLTWQQPVEPLFLLSSH